MRAIMDTALILRNSADAAETATAAETAIALDLHVYHYLNSVGGGMNDDFHFKAVFHNMLAGGDVVPTSVVVAIEVGDAIGFGGSTAIVRSFTAGTMTSYEMVLSMYEIRKLLSTATHIRSKITVTGGTNPTFTYGCYLTKV